MVELYVLFCVLKQLINAKTKRGCEKKKLIALFFIFPSTQFRSSSDTMDIQCYTHHATT